MSKKRFSIMVFLSVLFTMLFAMPALAGWEGEPGHWWWRNSDGSYPYGGAATIDGVKYVFDDYGYVKENAWTQMNNGKWYYSLSGGEVATDCWIGDYYMDSDGYMMTNGWTPDGYYVGADGKWIPNYGQETKRAQEYWIIDGNYDNREQGGYSDRHRVDMFIYMNGSATACHVDFGLYDATGTTYSLYDKYDPNGDSLDAYSSDGYNWTGTSSIRGDTFDFTYNGQDTIVLKWRNTTWGGGQMTFKRRGGGGAG